MPLSRIIKAYLLIVVLAPIHAQSSEIEDQVRRGIAPVVETLPVKLDGITTLDSILVIEPKIINYKYRVDFWRVVSEEAEKSGQTAEELINKALQTFGTKERWISAWGDNFIKPLYIKQNCSTPSTLKFLDGGFTIMHMIYDMEGNFIYQVVVDSATCASLAKK